LLVWVKSPVVEMEAIVREASPELVSVAACVVVVCTTWGAKFRLAVNPATGATPVPESVAEAVKGCGLVNESVAALLPRESGLNVTDTVQLAPGTSDAGQLFVSLKSVLPKSVMALRFSGAVPLFARVRFCAALVATCWLPKLTVAGVNTGTGATPVPLKLDVRIVLPVGTLSVPERKPAAAGVNVTCAEQLAPVASTEEQLLVWLKSPVVEIAPTFTQPCVALMVNDCAELEVPTGWTPKSRVAGDKAAAGGVVRRNS
jgi:hypothetical protein